MAGGAHFPAVGAHPQLVVPSPVDGDTVAIEDGADATLVLSTLVVPSVTARWAGTSCSVSRRLVAHTDRDLVKAVERIGADGQPVGVDEASDGGGVGGAMFKLGGSRTDGNPIKNLYEMGKQVATGGPEGAWRVYEGHRKSDAKVGDQGINYH